MKLRNKNTGEIVEVCRVCPEPFEAIDFDCKSLAELNEEWEDYEEPKEHWYIDWDGKLMSSTDEEGWKAAISIGNYFSSKEEAEKAVEKLKAWKRLKDKCNFRFAGIERNEQGMLKGIKVAYERINATFPEAKNIIKDLFLLFGGEDE